MTIFFVKKRDDLAKNFAGVATLILKSRKKIWNSLFHLILFCSIKILRLIVFVTILFWPKEIVPNYHFMVFDLNMTSINVILQCQKSWYIYIFTKINNAQKCFVQEPTIYFYSLITYLVLWWHLTSILK